MSRLRPFAYTTGVGKPFENPNIIQPSTSGTAAHAKQLQILESDINPLSINVNFVAKEYIDGSVQVWIRIMGSSSLA